MSEAMARGRCPGVRVPMKTGDGYLLRLRISNGHLTAEQLDAIADLSLSLGNGAIDLSARANLQLRGVTEQTLKTVQEKLSALGLADVDAEAEAVRNVTPSPLAGFDPTSVLDARPIVEAIERRLTWDASLRALPAKFGFLVDGGGALPLTGVAADVRFEAFATARGPRVGVRLADAAVCSVEPPQVAEFGAAIAKAFLALRQDERRMSALLRRASPAEVLDRAGARAADYAPAARRATSPRDAIGLHALGAHHFLGLAAPFGNFRAADLKRLSQAMRASGAGACRLTPWRAILLVGLDIDRARRLADEARSIGLIIDAGDPRLSIAACVGKPSCASAKADVRDAALRLLSSGRILGGAVHISGCAKGCAHSAAAALTLVATPEGFDVVENGRARDLPAQRGLSLDGVANFLDAASRGTPA